MKKNNNFNNTLIKRKGIVAKLRKQKITRIDKEAINSINEVIEDILSSFFIALKEEMTINGRKTLKKEDIKNVLKKMKEENFWEI